MAISKFLVTEYMMSTGGIRGYIKTSENHQLSKLLDQNQYNLKQLFQKGIMILTLISNHGNERYQGIINCDHDHLSDVIQSYFSQSEQTPTHIHLAVGQNYESGHSSPKWQGGGLIIQNYPEIEHSEKFDIGEVNPENYWEKAISLVNTMTDAELIEDELSFGNILYRLFHEDGVKLMPPQHLNRFCTCNRNNILNILTSFNQKELEALVKHNKIETECEFCQSKFVFTLNELKELKAKTKKEKKE